VRLLGSPLNCRVAPATRLRQRLEKEKKPRRVTGRKAVVASPGPSFCLAAGRGARTRFQSPNKCSIMRAGAERASAVKRGANLISLFLLASDEVDQSHKRFDLEFPSNRHLAFRERAFPRWANQVAAELTSNRSYGRRRLWSAKRTTRCRPWRPDVGAPYTSGRGSCGRAKRMSGERGTR